MFVYFILLETCTWPDLLILCGDQYILNYMIKYFNCEENDFNSISKSHFLLGKTKYKTKLDKNTWINQDKMIFLGLCRLHT